MEKHVTYKGKACTVEAVKGGWTTLMDASGKVFKVRNGELPRAAKTPKEKKPKALGAVKRGIYDGDVSKLTRGKGVTAGGNPTLDKDDKASKMLRGLTFPQACDVVARAEVEAGEAETISGDIADMEKAYGKLNPGLQRMNLGNRLRGALGLNAK